MARLHGLFPFTRVHYLTTFPTLKTLGIAQLVGHSPTLSLDAHL